MDLKDLKYNQRVAKAMREEHGFEMTPEQVIQTREIALRKIRCELAKEGIECPIDDVELMKWLNRIGSKS